MTCVCASLGEETEVSHEAGEPEARLPPAFDTLVPVDGARDAYRCPSCGATFSLMHSTPGGSWDFQRTYYVKTLRRL